MLVWRNQKSGSLVKIFVHELLVAWAFVQYCSGMEFYFSNCFCCRSLLGVGVGMDVNFLYIKQDLSFI